MLAQLSESSGDGCRQHIQGRCVGALPRFGEIPLGQNMIGQFAASARGTVVFFGDTHRSCGVFKGRRSLGQLFIVHRDTNDDDPGFVDIIGLVNILLSHRRDASQIGLMVERKFLDLVSPGFRCPLHLLCSLCDRLGTAATGGEWGKVLSYCSRLSMIVGDDFLQSAMGLAIRWMPEERCRSSYFFF